jgi:hypothetical protein
MESLSGNYWALALRGPRAGCEDSTPLLIVQQMFTIIKDDIKHLGWEKVITWNPLYKINLALWQD